MPTLIAYLNDAVIFQSDGPWLYPLLELETVLKSHASLPEQAGSDRRLTTYDKVVGRAGALLSARLGVRAIRTDLLSRRAIPVLERFGIDVQATDVQDRIFCATEDLLSEVTDPDEAYRFLMKRLDERRRAQAPVISVTELGVTRGKRGILRGLSLSIRPGETVLIRGENGAGKTTFLKALLGLLPVSSGSIDVEHRRVGSPAWRAQRHRVAYVRQSEETGNLPISAVEVAELGARAHSRGGVRRRAKEALHRAHAEHLERRLYTELSGGERQRVSIARALAQEPSVLLLDEPTVGLDVDARRSLLELLHGLAQRQAVTVIVVSHDLAPDDLPLARPLTLADGILLEDARA